jgi:hypothetical protein
MLMRPTGVHRSNCHSFFGLTANTLRVTKTVLLAVKFKKIARHATLNSSAQRIANISIRYPHISKIGAGGR